MKKVITALVVLAILLPCTIVSATEDDDAIAMEAYRLAEISFRFGVAVGLQMETMPGPEVLEAIFLRFLQGLQEGDFDQPTCSMPEEQETEERDVSLRPPPGWPYKPPVKPDLAPPRRSL